MDPISLGAQWITSPAHHDDPGSLPVLARRIEVSDDVERAVLRVACLGVLSATIDGVLASDDVLEPGYSDWRRVGEHTIWDVTHLLTPGQHVVRFELGGGMYRSRSTDGRWTKVTTDFGDIAVAAVVQLTHTDQCDERIVSDTSWRATQSATLVANWVGGETYDARRERHDLEAWPDAVLAAVPADLKLVAKKTPPLRVIETLHAKAVVRHGEQWIVDYGVNSAGWPVLDLPPGSSVRLRPAELLTDDGAVDVRTEGWGPVYHDVRSADAPLTWRPRMSYNGLRYLEVSGLTAGLDVSAARFEVIHADVPETSGFTTDDERLNGIWRLVRQAIRSNMMSVFTDCPQREKLGYLEEIHALHDLLVRTYASGPILEWMLDLTVQAQRADGSIGLCVPEWEEFPDPWRGDPNWGGAIVLLPLARFHSTGDPRPIELALPAMRRYLDFLLDDRDDSGLVQYGLGDFNGKSVKQFRDVGLVSTATLHKLLLRAAEAADIVGAEDGGRWRELAGTVRTAFHRAFLRPDGTFGPGSVTAHVVTLDADLAPPSLLDTMERQIIEDAYVLDVGAVTFALLVEQLGRAGRHDTLFAITRVTNEPSYGYMLAHGATALTECWDGPTFGFSQNHFMFGAIATWFHEYVLGIRQTAGTTAWAAPLIAPVAVGDVTTASGWFDAPTGRIEVSWTVEGGVMVVEGDAGGDVGATVRLPSGRTHTVHGRFHLVDEPGLTR